MEYLSGGGNMAGDSNVDWESGFEWAGSGIIVLFTHIIRFKVKNPRETAL